MDATRLIEIAVPALTSALIAGVGAVFAYRKWWQERTEGFGAQFRARRTESYEELWRRLEQLHSYLRGVGTQEAAAKASLELNSYLLERSVYIDAPDRRLAADYMSALIEVAARVWSSENQQAKEAWTRTMERIPEETLLAARELSEAWQQADELRNSLIKRTRAVMGAKFVLARERE